MYRKDVNLVHPKINIKYIRIKVDGSYPNNGTLPCKANSEYNYESLEEQIEKRFFLCVKMWCIDVSATLILKFY